MVAGFDESSTRSNNNITSTVFDKCIIKLALVETGGKFRRQGGGVMCEAIGVKHESTLVRSRSPCFCVRTVVDRK
jgi:hypothetical protein